MGATHEKMHLTLREGMFCESDSCAGGGSISRPSSERHARAALASGENFHQPRYRSTCVWKWAWFWVVEPGWAWVECELIFLSGVEEIGARTRHSESEAQELAPARW